LHNANWRLASFRQPASRAYPQPADQWSKYPNATPALHKLAQCTTAIGFVLATNPMGVIAAALGNHDLAFEWLDTAVTERDPQLTWQLKTDPVLAPLPTAPATTPFCGE
jgi:hypothetical protein